MLTERERGRERRNEEKRLKRRGTEAKEKREKE